MGDRYNCVNNPAIAGTFVASGARWYGFVTETIFMFEYGGMFMGVIFDVTAEGGGVEFIGVV